MRMIVLHRASLIPTGAVVNERGRAEEAALVYDVPIADAAPGRCGIEQTRPNNQRRATNDRYAAIDTWS